MPVTAKLSRRFYEQFGDDIANELVNWFNAVDAQYRSDLRDLNEQNFARFDAKMEQRFAEQDAKWERRFAEHDAKWERRFADLDSKWERRLADLESNWERRFAGLRVEFAGLREEMASRFAAQDSRLLRWMFTFWMGTMLGLAGLFLTVLQR